MANMFKSKLSWIQNGAIRLDAAFYGGPGQREAQALIASNIKKKELRNLTIESEDGIYIPSRFKRIYVDDDKAGFPYLTGSLIVQENPLERCKYLSRTLTKNRNRLLLQPDSIIVTCSGLIGNCVFVTDFFSGAIGSPDLMRILPDHDAINPAYLYAFLSSKIGKALITQHTYGSVVKHIEAHHIYSMPIAILDNKLMGEISDLIIESSKLRNKSRKLRLDALSIIEENLTFPKNNSYTFNSTIRDLHGWRLDPPYHQDDVYFIEKKLQKIKHDKIKTICTDISLPGRFRRLDSDGGVPLYTITDVRSIKPKPSKRIPTADAKQTPMLKVLEDTILVWRSGVTVGDCFYTHKLLANSCITEDLIRVIPDKSKIAPCYLYGFMLSSIGQKQIKRFAFGSAQDHLAEWQIGEVLVARLDTAIERKIADIMKKSISLSIKAIEKENIAIFMLEQELAKWLD